MYENPTGQPLPEEASSDSVSEPEVSSESKNASIGEKVLRGAGEVPEGSYFVSTKQKLLFSNVEMGPVEPSPVLEISQDEKGVFTTEGFERKGKLYPYTEEFKQLVLKEVILDTIGDASDAEKKEQKLEEQNESWEVLLVPEVTTRIKNIESGPYEAERKELTEEIVDLEREGTFEYNQNYINQAVKHIKHLIARRKEQLANGETNIENNIEILNLKKQYDENRTSYLEDKIKKLEQENLEDLRSHTAEELSDFEERLKEEIERINNREEWSRLIWDKDGNKHNTAVAEELRKWLRNNSKKKQKSIISESKDDKMLEGCINTPLPNFRYPNGETINLIKEKKRQLNDAHQAFLDQIGNDVCEYFSDLRHRIGEVVVPDDLKPFKDIYILPVGYVVEREDGECSNVTGSPLDQSVIDCLKEGEKEKWIKYWKTKRQGGKGIEFANKKEKKAVTITRECLLDETEKKYEQEPIKNKDSAFTTIQARFERDLLDMEEQYMLEPRPLLDVASGKVYEEIQPIDKELLGYLLPKIGPFINGIDLSNPSGETTLKSTRLSIMEFMSGDSVSGDSLLCTHEGLIKIRVFEELLKNTEPEKYGKAVARLNAAVGEALYSRLSHEQLQDFRKLLGKKVDVSRTSFYAFFGKTIADRDTRKRIAERTFFLKAFNAYMGGKVSDNLKEYFDGLKKFTLLEQ